VGKTKVELSHLSFACELYNFLNIALALSFTNAAHLTQGLRHISLYSTSTYSGLKNRCNVWQFWSGCDVVLDRVRMMLSVGGVK